MRVLLVDSDKPGHFIVARPGISTVKDLIAKTVGISDFAGATGVLTRVALEKSGVPPEKVNMRALGPPPYVFQALLAGIIDAAPLNFIMSKAAEQKGFRIIAYTGRFCP